MDTLSLLRDYTIRQELGRITIADDAVRFGDTYAFPRDADTAYRSKQGGLYRLDCLAFFIQSRELWMKKHTDYIQQARALKVPIVTFTDRKSLQDYLEGKVTSSDAIELRPPLVQPLAPAPMAPGSDEPAGAADEPASKRSRLEAAGESHMMDELAAVAPHTPKVDDIEKILARERPVRDRESILVCHRRSFRNIVDMLDRRAEERRQAEDLGEPERRGGRGATAHHLSDKDRAAMQQRHGGAGGGGGRHGDVEEKHFWKERLGLDVSEELGIDPSQSHLQDTKIKDGSRSVQPVQSSSRHRVLHPQGFPRASPKLSAAAGPPIILVPNASATLITTYNVKGFLEDGTFVQPDVKSLGKKPELVVLQRKMGRDKHVTYHVRDKPTSLSTKDWERVVAVFVLGKEWQFKDWPRDIFAESATVHVRGTASQPPTPPEIFSKILGVYVRFDEDSLEAAKMVKQWNVKIISLSKHKRHQDRTAVLNFWESLDNALRTSRSPLIF
eukprot:SM000168S02587  [mRNA]  locus=s168:51086:54004:- [translate_table: standard]